MESKTRKQVIIPKEKAVFRMDANGNWHNEHGKFEHPGIIKHFNASIRKDENGYFVYQSHNDIEEKVYFNYEDTAIFARDIVEKEALSIVLNTTETIKLEPQHLLTKEDSLYMQTQDHLVKFTTRAMMKLSKYLTERNGKLFLTIKGQDYKIE